MNNEIPQITLAYDNPNNGPDVVLWISAQEGTWGEEFRHGRITIRRPNLLPLWNSSILTLHPRGSDTADNKRLMVATREDFARIVEAVKAFNAYHEEASRRAKAAEEAKKPKPRMILAALELGSETNSRECMNCGSHRSGTRSCLAYGKHLGAAFGWHTRHRECIAAEARYNDMHAARDLDE